MPKTFNILKTYRKSYIAEIAFATEGKQLGLLFSINLEGKATWTWWWCKTVNNKTTTS